MKHKTKNIQLSINSLARSNLKRRKKQYTLMFVGILLSMIMSSTVLFFASSMLTSISEYKKINYGDFDYFHYSSQLDDSFYSDVQKAGAIEDYAYSHVIGNIYKEKDSTEIYTPIAYLDEKSMEFYYPSFLEGGYPTASGQIALERSTLELLSPGAKLGDEITVYMRGQNGADLLDGYVEKTFKVVGIIRNKKSNINALSTFQHDHDMVPSAFVFDGSEALPGSKPADVALVRTQEVAEGEDNWYDYMREVTLSGARDFSHISGYDDGFVWTSSFFLMIIGIIFCGVLLIATFIGIINAMNSNIADRKKQIGMLRTVGATKRQIRKIFGREAIFISLICAPVSAVVSYFLIQLVGKLFGEDFVFILNIPVLILSVLFGVVCVIISSSVPLRSASKISPVQSIRNIEITRQMKTKHIKSKKDFDVSKLLAKRNIGFYRRKQVVVSFFLVITIVVSCFGFSWIQYNLEYIDYDAGDYELFLHDRSDLYEINIREDTSSKYTENMKQEVLNIPYISEVRGVKFAHAFLEVEELSDYMKLYMKGYYGDDYGEDVVKKDPWLTFDTDKELFPVTVHSLEDREIESMIPYVEEGKIDLEALDSGREVILLAPNKIAYGLTYYSDGGTGWHLDGDEDIDPETRGEYLEYADRSINAGDGFTLKSIWADYNDEGLHPDASPEDYDAYTRYTNLESINSNITIGAHIRDLPTKISGSYAWVGYNSSFRIFTTHEGMKKLCGDFDYMHLSADLTDYYRENMTDAIDKEITDAMRLITLRFPTDTYISSDYANEKDNNTIFLSILLAGIAGMVLLMAGSMSIINNSLTARIRENKREIGTLRAVGATQKDLTMSYIRQLLSMFGWGTGLGFGIFFVAYIGWYIYCEAKNKTMDILNQQKFLESSIDKATARTKEIAVMYEKLFEKHINGIVNEESFMQLSQKYEAERDELKMKIRQYQEELSEIENLRTSKEQFTFAVRKFMQMETLTPALLNELIEKIEVHSIEGKGKNKTQKIIIHYRFIGVIENPVKEENIVLEARQGVAVEYLTA